MKKSGMRPELRASIPVEISSGVARWFEAALNPYLHAEACQIGESPS